MGTTETDNDLQGTNLPPLTAKLILLRFFSKLVFICNLCFIAAVILREVENANKKKGNFDGAIKLQPLQSTIVVLGYSAIIINIILNLVMLVKFLLRKEQQLPKWLIWFNFLILLAQVYYFFF
jgi:hypothetical protein